MTTIRFDKAWENAYDLAAEISADGVDVVLVRDLLGRLSLIVDDTKQPIDTTAMAARLRTGTGAFAASTPVFTASSLFDATALLESPDLLVQHHANPETGHGRFSVLERTAVGADWSRPSLDTPDHRVALYGFKGGVGRSTATFMLAKHLAELGNCVLVADLDLESPGVGDLIQRPEDRSEHGIVDYLVESVVGNHADLDLVSRSGFIQPSGNGEVWLMAADGRPLRPGERVPDRSAPTRRDYLAKLNRAYAEAPTSPAGVPGTLAGRLRAALDEAEAQVADHSRRPDVVLLDSRAGIHDIAAIAITQLSGLSLLFANDNEHTWTGYRALFDQWSHAGRRLDDIRQRLQMVASFVPGNNQEEYLSSFRDHSQQCFAETLYDDMDADDDEAFNFSRDDEHAPHSPIEILFSSDLVGLNYRNDPDWHEHVFVTRAYERFLDTTSKLIAGEVP